MLGKESREETISQFSVKCLEGAREETISQFSVKCLEVDTEVEPSTQLSMVMVTLVYKL